ncbi:hypothetical protein [Sinomicrobium soli]|uniref:hypothetical protein n=1 Tax=Sinomicrobium sp. N-1-3-6 TaxID=2219864 RepID=UPI000DCE7A84|nr:hypothetical protein [Sinomicrobium sp. N-1-3-6]RAV30248.1 hypothetical protein DN748_05525 [Sinomicrobium sp. N-1-3-6]
MASVKDLKKNINNVLGDIIEAVYLWEAATGNHNSEAGNAVIDEAIETFDALIEKVNDRNQENRSAYLKEVNGELEKKAEALIEKVNALA